ncbi:toll/interleukin-1 receptor domain-containing protein [Isoptericola sp. NPDC019482]|uniref:toll/interleukin-1 receptor domain-containing protein n=1 Tax=Isoptericola sp. NPDC019482 TaxID=3154688 RepID=UPI0034870563
MKTTKVFLSWSLDLSKSVAGELYRFLKGIFDPNVELFLSEEDIEVGDRGQERIAEELADTSVGIIVVTRENWSRPWLNFEAGALSKAVGGQKSRVIPLLVDLQGSEIKGPLTNFQYVLWNRADVGKLIKTLNGFVGVDPGIVERRLDSEWPTFNEEVNRLIGMVPVDDEEKRTPEDKLEEVLELVRAIHRNVPVQRTAQADLRVAGIGASSPFASRSFTSHPFTSHPFTSGAIQEVNAEGDRLVKWATTELMTMGLTPRAVSWDSESRQLVHQVQEEGLTPLQVEEFRRRAAAVNAMGVLLGSDEPMPGREEA